MTSKIRIYLAVAAVVACIVASVLITLWVVRPAPKAPEKAADQVVQSDGSVILERTPTVAATAPAAKPKAKVPKGGKVERKVAVTVKPTVTDTATVDLAVVRMPDESRRVIASSDDGIILGGIDIPVDPQPIPPPKRVWAAGLYVNPSNREERGLWVERDFGRIRAGVDVGADARGAANVRVRVGISF